MEIRINVDDEYMKKLKEKLGEKKASQIALDAITLLNWAVNEKSQGKEILSAGSDGEAFKLLMPALEKVKSS